MDRYNYETIHKYDAEGRGIYFPLGDQEGQYIKGLWEDKDGDWIKYSDYQEQLKKIRDEVNGVGYSDIVEGDDWVNEIFDKYIGDD